MKKADTDQSRAVFHEGDNVIVVGDGHEGAPGERPETTVNLH